MSTLLLFAGMPETTITTATAVGTSAAYVLHLGQAKRKTEYGEPALYDNQNHNLIRAAKLCRDKQ
jgi:hypothetical protein